MSHANAEAYCAGIDGHLAYWDLNLINFGSIENALDTFSGSQTYWTAGKLESDGYYWHPSGKSEQYAFIFFCKNFHRIFPYKV